MRTVYDGQLSRIHRLVMEAIEHTARWTPKLNRQDACCKKCRMRSPQSVPTSLRKAVKEDSERGAGVGTQFLC